MQETGELSREGGKERTRHIFLLGLAGAYANCVAYGFCVGGGNHQFELPLTNWLRDPSLYPQDPITHAFGHFPTVFWPAVAFLSQWMAVERILFVFFVLTKLLFFVALARLVVPRVTNELLAGCIVLCAALSPFLNDLTPFGASNILDSIETQTSLSLALLLWVGCFLLEGRWIRAAALCALTVNVNALFCSFMAAGFIAFVLIDWRRRRTGILIAGLVGLGISLPWVLRTRGGIYLKAPAGYVGALLAYYPFHITLRGHEAYELISGLGLVLAAALMVMVARKSGERRDFRLEALAASFFVPVFLGALIGEVYLTPMMARMQMLRADSFLLLYSILIVQIYGANLLGSRGHVPGTTCFLGLTAIVLPLSNSLGLLWLLFIAMIVWAGARGRSESIWRGMARRQAVRAIGLVVLLAGAMAARLAQAEWSLTVTLTLIILAGVLLVCDDRSSAPAGNQTRIIGGVCAAAILIAAVGTVPGLSRLWNPIIPATPQEADWFAVQEWAKANTPRDAQFLAPTYPGGFREFSERSSWGEWADGIALYLDPSFTDAYRERMLAVGYSWGKWNGTESITEKYKHLSWEQLLMLGRENGLRYIIQFRDVAYPAAPVFANQHYAVYKVELNASHK
ncbi:MAG: DUF6798 domain-containing protein [Candidatus Acidiferrales bacterium]